MPFGGVIKESYLDSTPYWPPRVVPPKGAPNILLIMTDDQGYGISSAFGGVIPTLSMDRVAKAGLRYTQFHSTALCSPTRAALITGRNHHSVGSGVVGELATGFPGYHSIITKDKATIAEVLKENGYATSWFGKGSWAARPTSGRRICSRIIPRFSRGLAGRITTSRPTWRMRRSGICTA